MADAKKALVGKVVSVIGAVVDVQFDGGMCFVGVWVWCGGIIAYATSVCSCVQVALHEFPNCLTMILFCFLFVLFDFCLV